MKSILFKAYNIGFFIKGFQLLNTWLHIPQAQYIPLYTGV